MMKRALMISALVAVPFTGAMAQSDTKTPGTITPPIGTSTPGVVNPPVGTTTGATTTTTTTTGRTSITFVQQQMPDQMLASGLIGATVRGSANETIGEIDDVILDRDGRAQAVVIGVGGFLGIGEKDVAVPFMALEANHDAKNPNKLTMRIASTKEALKAAPEFVKADAVASTTTTTTTPGATGAGQPRTPLSPSAPPAATAPAPTPVTPK